MKKLFGIAATIVVLFVSCYEVNEEIVVNENGTGTYLTKMDMSAMVQMMQTMAGEEELSKNGLDRPIDTLIYLKNIMDTASDATPEQKKLFRDGTMKLQMNIKENLLKADVHFPFKSYGDLATLMSGSGTGGMAKIFKNVFSEDDSSEPAGPVQDQGLDQINSVFDVTVTKNSIVRKLNNERYEALMQQPEMAQAKQMAGSGFEVLYTTTILLPRPVKQSDNALVKLSDDKKTVTIKYDLMDLFKSPEKFSYSIAY